MTTTPGAFNDQISKWKSELDKPWMRLRYELVAERLAHHLPPGRLRVLDAGGGNGMDALALAKRGNEVTLVDYADRMLQEARAAAIREGVDSRMRFVQGDVLELADLVGDTFDAVLSHNVLQYADDLQQALRVAVSRLRPGGMFSLILLNRYAETLRAALYEWDFEEAAAKVGIREMQARLFDTTLRLYDAAEVETRLRDLGIEIVQTYGLRCVNDYIRDDERKFQTDYHPRMMALERRLGTEYPYYLVARFFHIIARRP